LDHRRYDLGVIELADGTLLWTAVSGNGPPLVLCHGGPGLWDYLAPLAALLDDTFTVIRFDQRGCGRSTDRGGGRFTIEQALDDLDQVRAALRVDHWGVVGHSWGAELALRYAAHFPDRVTGVVYVAGVGAGDGFRDGYVAERERRLGADLPRWTELGSRQRNPAEEREWCLLQWRSDFSPGPATLERAAALWATRPPDVEVNTAAYRQLWADRDSVDLLTVAAGLCRPVTMLLGADDPRPWQATDSLFAALPAGNRIVFDAAGHAPWVEQPFAVRDAILTALATA
jgi:proline iminopeptidase